MFSAIRPHRWPRLARPGALAALVLVLGGCGFGLDSEAGDPSADSVTTAASSTPPASTNATVVPGDSTAQPASSSDSTEAGGPAQGDTQGDTLAIDERIDQLVQGQERLTRQVSDLVQAMAQGNAGGLTVPAVADSAGANVRQQGLGASGEVLGAAGEKAQNFGVGVVWSVIVVIIFNFLVRGVVWVLNQLSEQSVTRRLFFKRLVPIIRIVLWIFAAYLIVSVIFQVDRQGLFAAATAVGVAIGFAAQDLLKNLFGGIILVFDQPFQVGDKISVSGTYGEVVSIGLRSTRIVTADDNLVSVPNSQVVDQQVANANAGELNCQVVTDLYLPGFTDEARAKKIAFEAAATSRYVYMNKPIVVLVKDEFKETFLTRIRVKAYVMDPRFEFMFQSDVTERARAGFRNAGLTTPQQVVHGIVAVEGSE